MPQHTEYRQCRLKKQLSASACTITVSYIPAKFAHPDRKLRLRNPDGSWEDGWVVQHVGPIVRESELPNPHQAARRHRQATGDSLPRER